MFRFVSFSFFLALQDPHERLADATDVAAVVAAASAAVAVDTTVLRFALLSCPPPPCYVVVFVLRHPSSFSRCRSPQDPYGNYVVQYVLGICGHEEADKLVSVPIGQVTFCLLVRT